MKKNKDIVTLMLNSCFSFHSEEARQVMLSFASYVGGFKVNRETAPLYLRIIGTNELSVVNSLLKNRAPFFLFRNIKPDAGLLQQAFDILSQQDPLLIYDPVLLSLLGLVDMAYKSPSEGSAEHEVTKFDLNHIAKYLDETKSQDHHINKLILRILEYFYYSDHEVISDTSVNSLGIYSMRIRFAFFDKKHALSDIIPEQLMGPKEEYPSLPDE